MNEIKLFENPMFGEIRSVELYEQVYFVAKDVTNALGYTNSQDAVKRHCRWVAKHDLPHPQAKDKTLEVNVIPKGDVIRLVSNSKLPAAQEFESWIFDEVIPNVMESGKYEVQPQVVETQQAIEQPTSNSELSIADRMSGVSSGVISSAITGKQKPGLESRGKICVALGKSVDWLNGGAQL